MTANPTQTAPDAHVLESESVDGAALKIRDDAGSLKDHAPLARRSRAKSDSAFKTISEVADELDVQQHVLRFWETKFSQIKPLKRGGGRRYYRPEDVELLKTIYRLLYTEGYTIKGVQKLMREQGKNKVISEVLSDEAPQKAPPANTQEPKIQGQLSDQQKTVLKSMLSELKELRKMIGPDSESA